MRVLFSSWSDGDCLRSVQRGYRVDSELLTHLMHNERTVVLIQLTRRIHTFPSVEPNLSFRLVHRILQNTADGGGGSGGGGGGAGPGPDPPRSTMGRAVAFGLVIGVVHPAHRRRLYETAPGAKALRCRVRCLWRIARLWMLALVGLTAVPARYNPPVAPVVPVPACGLSVLCEAALSVSPGARCDATPTAGATRSR